MPDEEGGRAAGESRAPARSQEFLLLLSDALRRLSDPLEVEDTATRLLADHLGVSHASYYESLPAEDEVQDGRGFSADRAAWSGRVVRLSEFGADVVHQREGRQWTTDEVRLIEEVAERTRAEVARARAERKLRESEGRLDFLLRLNDALRPLSRAPDILDTALRLLGEHLKTAWAYLGETDDPPTRLIVQREHARAGARSFKGIHALSSLELLRDLERGRTVVVKDLATSAQVGEGAREPFGAAGMRSFLGAPIVKKDGRYLAVVVVADREPRLWSEFEIALVEDVADRTWAAVERARVEEELRASEERQQFLLGLSDALRPLADPLRIQDAATRILALHLEVAHAYYYEVAADENETVVGRGYSATGPAWPDGFRSSDFGEPTLAAFRRGETLVFGDTERDSRLDEQARAAFRKTRTRAAVGVPLLKEGRLAGTLGVHQPEPRWWTPAQVRLIEEVAERTWSAVERAHAEAALREVAEQLRAADQRKSDFLAMLGHELRNPLAALEGGIKLLQSPRARAESRQAALPIVAQQVAHMKRLIDDVLDLARLERGRLQVQLVEVDLHQILLAALRLTAGLARAKGSEIRYRPPAEHCRLHADGERLVQVFANLLANALKFSPGGSAVDLWVEVADVAEVYVRDAGRGIAHEDLVEIFEPFVQSKLSLGMPEGGLGLGLSVSRELVALQGGTIEAQSAGLERGSTFVVALPIPGRRIRTG